MAALKTGEKINNRYRLEEFKGSGSFGEVWLAHDEVLDSKVALKIYISLDPRGIEEFKSEYMTTEGISHPNLLTPKYFDIWDQRPFLVMKYCSKGSSSAKAGNMEEKELWRFIHDVSAGLGYLHDLPEPVIHQDIKPDNVLTNDSGRFLITDFGISKKVKSTMRKQSQRAVGAGATAYMGPERFDSNPSPVKASDIWSLGASVYELATGELPFCGLGGGMQRNGAEMPSLDQQWSRELNMVMQSCLAKEPWDRPTARQLEDYALAMMEGRAATPSWNQSPATNIEEPEPAIQPLANPTPIEESGETSGTETGTELNHEQPSSHSLGSPYRHSKNSGENLTGSRIGLAFGAIAILVVALIFLWPTPPRPVEKNGIDETATEMNAMDDENVCVDASEVGTDGSKEMESPSEDANQEVRSSAWESKEAPADNNAALLKSAQASGDNQQIQRLANQGYAPAYVPYARMCLENHNYQAAEAYAEKARRTGMSGYNAIFTALQNLGYYD